MVQIFGMGGLGAFSEVFIRLSSQTSPTNKSQFPKVIKNPLKITQANEAKKKAFTTTSRTFYSSFLMLRFNVSTM
jgi:hypothetical protein